MAHVRTEPDIELLDEKAVSVMLNIKPKRLQNWRSEGRVLPFHKIGGKVRYAKADILEYIAQNRRVPSVRASSRIAHDTY